MLRWLREHGVTSLHGKTWTITEGHLIGRNNARIAHGSADCQRIEKTDRRTTLVTELEALETGTTEQTLICPCIHNELAGSEGQNTALHTARMRISIDWLDSLLTDEELDGKGRWPMAKAAGIDVAAASSRKRRLDSPEPSILTEGMDAVDALWTAAAARHPVDWARFDQEIIERSAIGLTRRAIWDSITFTEHQQWQDEQSIAGHWMGLGFDLTPNAQKLVDENHPEIRAKFARWDAMLADKLQDVAPRAVYAGSIERNPADSLPNLKCLIMHRGLRTGLRGKSSGFLVLPNVVAETLPIKDFWGRDERLPGGATLLEPGLPELSDLAWETAQLLWEESFNEQDNPGPYREFSAAIRAAAEL